MNHYSKIIDLVDQLESKADKNIVDGIERTKVSRYEANVINSNI